MTKKPENQEPDVMAEGKVHVADWGDVLRIDVNGIGAKTPEPMDNDEAAAWKDQQNVAICEAMQTHASMYNGSFNSFVEWTVTGGAAYDGKGMRNVRKAKFAENYRAAITTCGWNDKQSGWATRIQATAYVPKTDKGSYSQYSWEPDSLYSTEFMALSPAVTTEFDGVKLLHLAGVVAWDKERNVLYEDEPRLQIRHVLEMITSAFEEAGGSKEDVCRLRPFCQTREMAGIFREEVERHWADGPRPVILAADRWDANLAVEVQVCGLIGNESPVQHEEIHLPIWKDAEHAVVRVSKYNNRELLHIGEIRAEAGTVDAFEEVRQVLQQIRDVMQSLSLSKEEVNLAMVYAGSSDITRKFSEAVSDVLNPAAVHLIPCGHIYEMNGRQLKVELTINRKIS